jgi:hypothetical protein
MILGLAVVREGLGKVVSRDGNGIYPFFKDVEDRRDTASW